MLTPLLEKMVLEGKASVKTHNHGVGGVGSIQVPLGKTIVIVQIIWHPFVDVRNTANSQRWVNESGSFLHTLKLRNKQNKYAFTFRDTFRNAVFLESGTTLFYPESAKIINTFLRFTEGSVDIDIMKFNNFSAWGVYSNYLPASTVEPIQGEGYGNITTSASTAAKTVLTTNFFGFVQPPWFPTIYYPPTAPRAGTSTLGGQTNEFEGTLPLTYPTNQFAIPPEPQPQDSDVSMFPVCTFTYVEINDRYIPEKTLQAVNLTKK